HCCLSCCCSKRGVHGHCDRQRIEITSDGPSSHQGDRRGEEGEPECAICGAKRSTEAML
ncbi:hypothetical protein H0H81_001516, partial [Sphagnurus paluster]